MILDIIVPIHTVSESNACEHWTKKHKRHKAQKHAIELSISGPIRQNLLEKFLPEETLTILLSRIAPRQFDYDNLVTSFKPIRDYIANILIPGKKIGRADDSDRLIWNYNQQKGKPKEYAIRIQIF